MGGIGYFTLPFGRDPDTATGISVCVGGHPGIASVMGTACSDGPYVLYQCTDRGGIPFGSVPVCRVSRPLLVGIPAVYLDTSAISYLKQDDSPIETMATLKFWEAARLGRLSLYLSDVALDELDRCAEPKRSILFDLLGTVMYTKITAIGSPEIERLVHNIRALGILPKKSVADTYHIAAAIHARCDVIASWNFKHLTKRETVEGIRTIALTNGCGSIDICSPERILEVYV